MPKQALTPDILFKFLVAEVAGQRGAIGVAQPAYMDLARQTRDPRIARRAAEISMFARNQAGALEAARLWVATDQDSERAQQTLALLLLNEGKLDEAEPILRTLLQKDPARQLHATVGLDRAKCVIMTPRWRWSNVWRWIIRTCRKRTLPLLRPLRMPGAWMLRSPP